MAIEVKKISLWDTLRLQLYVTVPGFLLGLVVPNRWFVARAAKRDSPQLTMRFLRELRDKYGCDHVWVRFPLARTLLVFAQDTMEAVLASVDNAADPLLKKRALAPFVPDALVISSGREWLDRRPFNESALDLGNLHRHCETFGKIAILEAERLTADRAKHLRWVDFQSLGERISHQIILGAGELEPELTTQLARMLRYSNLTLRHGPSFSAFYQRIERLLARTQPPPPTACLMHDSAALIASGKASESTRVPTQIGFWFFVLKDAVELHVARTLALIAAHPGVQQRVRDEVRAAGTLTPQAIDGLRYLEACIDEQLRLWTPVPLLLRRAVKPFALRDEIAVREGEQILIHAGFYHRDPRVFRDFADTFAPDAAAASHLPAVYPFSARRQSCPGRTLATFVLKATLASLLSRFRFELVGPPIVPGSIAYLYDHFDVELRPVTDA